MIFYFLAVMGYFAVGWLLARQKQRRIKNSKGEIEIRIIPNWLRWLHFFFWPLNIVIALIILAVLVAITMIEFFVWTGSKIRRRKTIPIPIKMYQSGRVGRFTIIDIDPIPEYSIDPVESREESK